MDTSCIDEVVAVASDEAMANARRLATEEGLLVGISSGANVAACFKVVFLVQVREKRALLFSFFFLLSNNEHQKYDSCNR